MKRIQHNAASVQSEKYAPIIISMSFQWKLSKNSQNQIYGQADVFSLLTTAKWMNNYRVTLKHNKNLLFIFVLNGFINDLWSSKAFDTRGILSTASDVHHWFMNGWKQMAQQLKLQERLLTINKRNVIRWNIYRDNNFHSRRQGLKCL